MSLRLEKEVAILTSHVSPRVLAVAENPSMGVPWCTEGFALWGTSICLSQASPKGLVQVLTPREEGSLAKLGSHRERWDEMGK